MSLYGNSDELYCALLLIDVMWKVESLRDIILLLVEYGGILLKMMLFFLVVLYLFSFYAFQYLRADFEAIQLVPTDDEQDHAPGFNMYCGSLYACSASVANVGLRAGGGLGEVLA